MSYAELAVTTNFSFLRGASHPGQFVIQAASLGYAAIGIADRNSLAGVVRAFTEWEKLEEATRPRLLIGARLAFRDGTPDILAYPKDRAAYGRLCQLLSRGKLRTIEDKWRAPKGECLLDLADLLEFREGLLLIVMPNFFYPSLAITAGKPAMAISPRQGFACGGREPETGFDTIKSLLSRLGPDTWLAASMLYTGEDRRRLKVLMRLARESKVPLIAVNDALYHHPDRRELQDIVTCIREHVTLDQAGRRLEANAERHLKHPEEMTRLFRACPDAVHETLRVVEQIEFTLAELKQNYPHEPVPPGKTADGHLRGLAEAGLKRRYPGGVPDKVRKLVEKELRFIADGEIAHYFLTVHDIVAYARDPERNILCQGRGSAANSAVCYALGITSIDPNTFDVLFERFLNANRREPPDIDVDFEHERREEVIQYIYRRYGRRRAALTATVISYRSRSAIREVGKVFGLTEDVTGRLADTVWGHHGDGLSEGQVRQGGGDPANDVIARAVHFAGELAGFPRHLSQHVGGFVLTEDHLDTIVPIGPAAMENRYFIEWDKDDLDALRIMKVDVLALGMLTCIRKAFAFIDSYSGAPPLELACVPQEDAQVYDMLCGADAIGVFQVESRAQMNMLPRLQPREFYDLVVEVAIVRPGPIQGGMVHPYLKRRKQKRDKPDMVFDYPKPGPEHPQDELKDVLDKTLGIPLFQEQAMKLAMVAAKFSAEQANGLRRAMATFRNVGTIGNYAEAFIGGMTKRGYDRTFAAACFEQIKGFGSYGFPESHAASFALLVYVSAWIKKHHPAAFAAALLNSQPMGFYAPAEIVRDAREHDVPVLPPDAAFSDWDNTLEKDDRNRLCLRLGLRQIDGFSENDAQTIMDRRRNADYLDFADFARRTALSRRALVILAEADAFRGFGLDRREGLWAVRRLPDDKPLPLFEQRALPGQGDETIAPLPLMPLPEQVLADYRTIRLSLKAYPTEFLRPFYDAEGFTPCAHAGNLGDGAFARVAGIVLVRQRPGEGKAIFITLSDETGICNVVMWEKQFERFRKETMGARLLLVEGRVQKSENIVHLMAEKLIDRSADLRVLSGEALAPVSPAPRHPRNVRILPPSRDFH
ncbi:MAG TPA: error-prone DNA polymerase [Rhizomicrobium sp.]|nr:error-prone DNA polymerase [Rhizomicrobium sp.]